MIDAKPRAHRACSSSRLVRLLSYVYVCRITDCPVGTMHNETACGTRRRRPLAICHYAMKSSYLANGSASSLMRTNTHSLGEERREGEGAGGGRGERVRCSCRSTQIHGCRRHARATDGLTVAYSASAIATLIRRNHSSVCHGLAPLASPPPGSG